MPSNETIYLQIFTSIINTEINKWSKFITPLSIDEIEESLDTLFFETLKQYNTKTVYRKSKLDFKIQNIKSLDRLTIYFENNIAIFSIIPLNPSFKDGFKKGMIQ